ncbi:MAG: heavy metal translocating P-type ATPase [Chloroflexota bacterium]
MALLQLALAGGLLLIGKGTHQQLRDNGILAKQPQTKLINVLTSADQRYQRIIQERVDPFLLGTGRQNQFKLLQQDHADTDRTDPASTDSDRTDPDSADPDTVNPDIRVEPSPKEKETNRLLGLSVVATGLVAMGGWFPPLILPGIVMGAYLLLPLYQRTFNSLVKERKLRLDLVVALYLTGFWAAGYYTFACLAYSLYYVGVKVVDQLKNRSQGNLSNLFGQQPRSVWRIVDGVEVQTPFHDIGAGDIVVVNAGEVIPVDGLVTEGIGSVDQHALTGESQPVEKEHGDEVFSSTLLLSGRLLIEVEKTGEHTLAGQITEILEETSSHQTESELKAQQFADRTALPTLAASLLALLTVGGTGAVAVLGACFGVNTRIVSLLSTMNYLTLASRQNVLVKDGRALERLKEVDTIVFDKTGTLTLEQPHVAQVHLTLATTMQEPDVLTYAAAAEYRQPHPIAKAIVAAAQERGLVLPEIDEARYQVGYGIEVQIEAQVFRVGSRRFMVQEGIAIPSEIDIIHKACQAEGHSLIFVAMGFTVMGALELHATIRPEAKQIVENLQARDLSTVIISGDQEPPTQQLATDLDIQTYFANTLPEQKSILIQELQEAGRVVCFIGDGINDAIALKQADVSISLRGATTIATDTAQVILMDQTLNQLPGLFEIADRFDQTLRAGLVTTILPGIICIGGVFVAGFGIVAAEILFQIGFFSGLAVAMRPLLEKTQPDMDK